MGRLEIDRLRSAFDADAQRLHSTISQKLSANDALLAQLAQAPSREARSRIESRMAQTHPCVVSLVKRESGASWGDESLRTAEAASSKAGHAALASVQPAKARYALVLAAEPTSFALQIDLKAMLPWQDWPMPNAASSVRLSVDHGGQPLVQQPGAPRLDAVAGLTESGELPRGWPLVFAQAADSLSQPFVVRVERLLVWADLPWSLMLNFALLWALLLLAARALLRQTTRPIMDIAVACGFASASHFGRCYRAAYGCRPGDDRAPRAQGSGP
mgnify:CR=1 FL=1